MHVECRLFVSAIPHVPIFFMKLFARVCVCVVANTFNAIADFNMPHTWLVSALCECAVDVFARCGRSLGTIVSEPADGHE